VIKALLPDKAMDLAAVLFVFKISLSLFFSGTGV
jgi:hypothetical protein